MMTDNERLRALLEQAYGFLKWQLYKHPLDTNGGYWMNEVRKELGITEKLGSDDRAAVQRRRASQ